MIFGLIAGGLAVVGGLELAGLRNAALEIALLSVAMGMMNPAISKIGAESVSLTFMTGTLSRIGGHLALAAAGKALEDRQSPADCHLTRAGIEASVWCGFLGGAVLSGVAASGFRTWGLLAPCAMMLALGLSTDCVTPAAEKRVSGSRIWFLSTRSDEKSAR